MRIRMLPWLLPLVLAAVPALAQDKTVELQRDSEFEKIFFLRQHFDQFLSAAEKDAFGKISTEAGAADEGGGKVPDFREAHLKIGQRTFCRTKLIGPGVDKARGAFFTITTIPKSPFTSLDRTYFEIHYAEQVGEGTGLANIVVKEDSTKGRPFVVIHPSGDSSWYFSFTARSSTPNAGSIRSHIQPTFFKKLENGTILDCSPKVTAICCIDVKDDIASCPELNPDCISFLWGKPRFSPLFIRGFQCAVRNKVSTIVAAHRNDPCRPVGGGPGGGGGGDVDFTITGVNLPSGMDENCIQIGAPGECQVMKVLESTATCCKVKVKMLQGATPGLKDVAITPPGGDVIIGDDIIEFTRLMLITPECIKFEAKELGAIVVLDCPVPSPMDLKTDGQFVKFAGTECQIFATPTPTRLSDTSMKTITMGGDDLNFASFVIEGNCPGAGTVKACPEGGVIVVPGPGNGGPVNGGVQPAIVPAPIPEEVCCSTTVIVTPVFHVAPSVITTRCVLIRDFIMAVPEGSGRAFQRSLVAHRRLLLERIRDIYEARKSELGVLAQEQEIRLIGTKLPTGVSADQFSIGSHDYFDVRIKSASAELICLGVTPREGAPLGFLSVNWDSLGCIATSENPVATIKQHNNFPALCTAHKGYVSKVVESSSEVIASLGSLEFDFEWGDQFASTAGQTDQLARNVTPVRLISPTTARARTTRGAFKGLTVVAQGKATPGLEIVREIFAGQTICHKVQPVVDVQVGQFIVPGSSRNVVRYSSGGSQFFDANATLEIIDRNGSVVRSFGPLGTAYLSGQPYAELMWDGNGSSGAPLTEARSDYTFRIRFATDHVDCARAKVEEWILDITIPDRPGGSETLVTGPDEDSVIPANVTVGVQVDGGPGPVAVGYSVQPNTAVAGGRRNNQRGCRMITSGYIFYTTPVTPIDIRYSVVISQNTATPAVPQNGLRLETVVDGTLNPWDMDPSTPGRQTVTTWNFGIDSGDPAPRLRGFSQTFR